MQLASDPRLNPFAHYARIRASSPVFFDQTRKIWQVYGYKEVQAVLADHATFSSVVYAGDLESQNLFTLDPPRHTQQRKRMSKAFSAQAVANLEERIRSLTHDLLDQVIETGRTDLIGDFALPLPITVITALLGTPVEDTHLFKRWSEDTIQCAEAIFQGGEAGAELLESRCQFSRYMEPLIEARKREPRDDFISVLVSADEEDDGLTPTEIVGTCCLLMTAGHETTSNLIGNAMWTFFEHPEVWERLRAAPELISSAIEEVLRYRPPATSAAASPSRTWNWAGNAFAPASGLFFSRFGQPGPSHIPRSRPLRYRPLVQPAFVIRPWHSFLPRRLVEPPRSPCGAWCSARTDARSGPRRRRQSRTGGLQHCLRPAPASRAVHARKAVYGAVIDRFHGVSPSLSPRSCLWRAIRILAWANHAEIIPLCRSRASTLGSRSRNDLNESIAGRLPPTAHSRFERLTN